MSTSSTRPWQSTSASLVGCERQIAIFKTVTAVSGKRIVILFHADIGKNELGRYGIMRYAKTWVDDGHDVQILIGTSGYVAADVAVLHVDLSEVPEEYTNLAMRYRVALNDKITDVRKTMISKNLVRPGDGYQGPVIVKSNLNHAGIPEDSAAMRRRRFFDRPGQYPVFPTLAAMPEHFWTDAAVVVEKFLPERDGDLYCLRTYSFVGDHGTCLRFKGPEPVVEVTAEMPFDLVEPDPAILAARAELKIDFGQIDYTMHEGNAVLFDVNKVIGRGAAVASPELETQRTHRARGLYKYFSD